MTIHTWAYSVNKGPESTIHSGSVDPEEIRALVATTYRVALEHITVKRIT